MTDILFVQAPFTKTAESNIRCVDTDILKRILTVYLMPASSNINKYNLKHVLIIIYQLDIDYRFVKLPDHCICTLR